MNKFEKYLKHVPLIYAIYIPINFFIHIIGIYSGDIMPHFTIILDFIRVVVIVAFAFFLAEAGVSAEQEKKAPSQRIMMVAGIAFLEWILNVVTSNMYVASYNHLLFYIVFGGLFFAGYFYETVAIYEIISRYNDIDAGYWKTVNILVVLSGIITWVARGHWNGKHIYVTLFLIAFRAVVRGKMIHWLEDVKPISEEASEET